LKEIYAVMYAYYSDWQLYGYFTNRPDADKYCAVHPERDCHVEILPCLDGQEDFSNITLKYEHEIIFDKKNSGWVMRDEPNRYSMYIANYLRSNSIRNGTCGWLAFKVNIAKDDRKLAENIAQDMLYQFLDFCNNKPTDLTVNDMNKILRKDEDERIEKQKQEEIRQKELKELARLKEKYEMD